MTRKDEVATCQTVSQIAIRSWLPTARAFEKASSSLLWARLVLLVGLVGLLTSWNGFFLSASRVIFALGRARIINPVFGRPHPVYGTPTASILFCGLVTFLGALLGKQAVLLLVNVGSLFIAVAFLGVAFSLFRIRGIDDRLTGLRGRLVPVLAGFGAGLILLMMLYPGSPVMLAWPTEWIILGFFVLAGMAFWFSGTQSRNAITEKEREELMLGSSAPAEKTGNVS